MLHIIGIITFWTGMAVSVGNYVYHYVGRNKRLRGPEQPQERPTPCSPGNENRNRDTSDSYIEESYRYEQE